MLLLGPCVLLAACTTTESKPSAAYEAGTSIASGKHQPTTTNPVSPDTTITSLSGNNTQTHLPGITVKDQASVTLAGSGCAPNAVVHVVLEMATHATSVLTTPNADMSGAFSVTVTVTDGGSDAPHADLSAGCISPRPDGTGWTQYDMDVDFVR
jgi:hypothetical protein